MNIRRPSTSIAAYISVLLILTAFVSGCQAIADIFKAGFVVGIIVVVVIILLIFGVAMMFRK